MKKSLDYVFGPYHQKATPNQEACQIDYLIQDNEKHIYICEFKFSSNPLGTSIISDMKEKIRKLSTPERTATFPVLFHIGGVDREVIDSKYFYRIIDIGEFVEEIDSDFS